MITAGGLCLEEEITISGGGGGGGVVRSGENFHEVAKKYRSDREKVTFAPQHRQASVARQASD